MQLEKIFVINSDADSQLDSIQEARGCTVEGQLSAHLVFPDYSLEDYPIILLDVSNDESVRGLVHFSDWFKEKYPSKLIFATSVQETMFHRRASQEKNYDERLNMYDMNKFLGQLKRALVRHGFELLKKN